MKAFDEKYIFMNYTLLKLFLELPGKAASDQRGLLGCLESAAELAPLPWKTPPASAAHVQRGPFQLPLDAPGGIA